MKTAYGSPAEIEGRSFGIIREELGAACPEDPVLAAVLLRVIHTTADFSFAETLRFSPGAAEAAVAALRKGALVITDTRMAEAGIDKARLARFGGEARCFMADGDVAAEARRNDSTRAAAAVDKAALLEETRPVIFAAGNAPTALFRICDLVEGGRLSPALVIGVPVGFVNVVESKERLAASPVPHIVNLGRRGGSAVAAAICNALLRRAEAEEEGRA